MRVPRAPSDASKIDLGAWFHAALIQPDSEITDVDGGCEWTQIHEHETILDDDLIAAAIQRPDERARVLPLEFRFEGYGKLLQCHPTAVRRGVSGFRVAKHLHLPVTHDKQAETAGRERDDALIGERTERFRDGLNRRRVVLHSAADELDVAVDRDAASDTTQRDGVLRVRRFPLLGYGKLEGHGIG